MPEEISLGGGMHEGGVLGTALVYGYAARTVVIQKLVSLPGIQQRARDTYILEE